KRIKAVIPEYDKVMAGNMVALEIGFTKMCAENPHFCNWVNQLKSLGNIV
ncbi:MAG: DUF4276 family protein, partial [Gammaproteobacteria bacterium]|nr:DUF4276 family protein [Gammaproteobacteria bacterium]